MRRGPQPGRRRVRRHPADRKRIHARRSNDLSGSRPGRTGPQFARPHSVGHVVGRDVLGAGSRRRSPSRLATGRVAATGVVRRTGRGVPPDAGCRRRGRPGDTVPGQPRGRLALAGDAFRGGPWGPVVPQRRIPATQRPGHVLRRPRQAGGCTVSDRDHRARNSRRERSGRRCRDLRGADFDADGHQRRGGARLAPGRFRRTRTADRPGTARILRNRRGRGPES